MTSDFVIRVAETGDVSQMQAIALDAYSVYVEKMGRDPAPMHADLHTHISNDTVFVVMSGGDIAVYVILCSVNDEWWLDNFATSLNHRGQGIGRLLVIAAEGWLAHRTHHFHLYPISRWKRISFGISGLVMSGPDDGLLMALTVSISPNIWVKWQLASHKRVPIQRIWRR